MASPSVPDSTVIYAEVEPAAGAAASAWRAMNPFARSRLSDEARAAGLEAVAAALEAHRGEVLAVCVEETALLEGELAPESARMTGTLRLMADAARKGAWRRAAHDPPASPPATAIGPNHDLRAMLVPLGPVAVFGASNFPLAYGVCGGDTASALAAGCPVVVKEHPAHPRTGRLLASIAGAALEGAGLPRGVFGYVLNEDPGDHAVARRLVEHPGIRAVGFTGSARAGMAIDRLARERTDPLGRPDPIPVFAEMGSVNPVFVTPGALAARAEPIADELASSILLRFGQQCTCPGLVFLAESASAKVFVRRLRDRFATTDGRDMLAPWIRDAYTARLAAIDGAQCAHREASSRSGSVRDRLAHATLWSATTEQFQAHPLLAEETFGPSALCVLMTEWEHHERLTLPGSLTLSIYADASDPADLARARGFIERHAHAAGRVIWNGVPTGVRACEAMVHGGPFPATNRPETTATGPRAMERWCRPVCFQNFAAGLAP